MLTKRRVRRQRKQQKKNNSLISKKTTFFVHFCAVQRETSRNFLVIRFMEEMLYVVLFTIFSLPPIFTLVAASISHFLTAAIKLSCYSSNEIGLICFFISGCSSFSVLERKNQLRCCFVSLKVRVAMRFTAETRGYLKCKISPRFTWRAERTYGRFSQNQDFLDA